MKVVFAPQAKGDLFDFGGYVSKENPRRAKARAHELRFEAIALGDHLMICRVDDKANAILRTLRDAPDCETLPSSTKLEGRGENESHD